jgi:hypothetical protein
MFNAILIKISMTTFTDIEKSILKSYRIEKRPCIAKAIPSKKSHTGDITIPDFKLYYRALEIKNNMVLTQKQSWRSME